MPYNKTVAEQQNKLILTPVKSNQAAADYLASLAKTQPTQLYLLAMQRDIERKR